MDERWEELVVQFKWIHVPANLPPHHNYDVVMSVAVFEAELQTKLS